MRARDLAAAVEWSGESGSPTAYVISENLKRRHLKTGQRAAVAVLSLPHFEREAKERQGERTDIGAKMPQSPGGDNVQGRARDKAGAAAGVGGRYVGAAKTIKRRGARS